MEVIGIAEEYRDFGTAIESEASGRTFRAGVNGAGVSYIQTRFQDGTIQELHITSSGTVESVFFDGAAWNLNGIMATKDDTSQAVYASDLMAAYTEPTFVSWNESTRNTPYTAGLTSIRHGFALCHGNYTSWQTISAWELGGNQMYIHSCDNGVPSGWIANGFRIQPLGNNINHFTSRWGFTSTSDLCTVAGGYPQDGVPGWLETLYLNEQTTLQRFTGNDNRLFQRLKFAGEWKSWVEK